MRNEKTIILKMSLMNREIENLREQVRLLTEENAKLKDAATPKNRQSKKRSRKAKTEEEGE